MPVDVKLQECAIKVSEVFNKLSKEDVIKFADEIEKIAEDAKVTGENPSDAIKKFLLGREFAIKQTELGRLKTITVNTRNKIALEKHGNKAENLEGIIGINDKQIEGIIPMNTERQYLLNKLNSFYGHIQTKFPDTFKLMVSDDRNLAKSIGKFINGKTDHGLDAGGLELVKGMQEIQNVIYDAKIDAGFNVQYLKNYMGKQRHPAPNLSELGFDKWKDTMLLNYQFKGTEEEATKILKESFDDITNKPYKDFWVIDDPMQSITKITAGKQFEMSRKFIPKSPEHYIQYLHDTGQNYFENNLLDIENAAGEIAAGKTFGPNYRASFEKSLRSVGAIEAKKDIGKMGEIWHGNALGKWRSDEKTMRSIFEFIVKPRTQPPLNFLGRTTMKLIQFTNMTKLSNSFFSVPSDWAHMAGVINAVTGDNFLQSFNGVMKQYFKNMKPGAKNGAESARIIANYAEDMLHETSWKRTGMEGRMMRNDGYFDKAAHMHMAMTGLGKNDIAARNATSKMLASKLDRISKTPFKNLGYEQQVQLKRFGIDESNFHLMQNGHLELPDGTNVIAVEQLEKLDHELFAGKTLQEKIKARDKLATGIFGYLSDLPSRGVPNNDISMKAWKAKLDINTPEGAAMHMIMQYKTYPVALMKTMAFITKTGGGKYGNLSAIGQTGAMSLVLSGMAFTARHHFNNLLKEDKKELVYDAKTLTEIALRSGIGGIYADMLFSDRPLVDATAPAISGVMSDVVGLVAQGKKALTGEQVRSKYGLRSTFGQEFINTFQRNTPTIPYTKIITDRYIFDNLREWQK